MYINFKYEEFYNNIPETISGQAIIIRKVTEKEYNFLYTIKMKYGNYKNKKFILSVKKDKDNVLEYGDLVELKGEYIAPSESRNYKGFNYKEYLKTKKTYGIIRTDNNSIKVIEKKKLNVMLIISNNIRNSIIKKTDKILPDKTSKLLIGILLGNKEEISEEIIESFKSSSLSHMLSVSGAHTAYIILGISYILNKSRISKRWTHIITILVLILFMFITNFTSSVIRACLMGILVLGAKIFFRKNDSITSISLSLLIILIYNPFLINEIGLQLSYLGTLGIILLNKNVKYLFSNIKISKKVVQLLSITFSAQLMIMPIMTFKFNTISLTFFISNVLASPFLGIIMIFGFITIFVSFVSYKLAKMLAIILNLNLEGLICISNITSKLPFSNILIKTPYVFSIIFIYCLILILNYMFIVYKKETNLRLFQKKIIKLINFKNTRRILGCIIVIVVLLNLFSYLYTSISQNLKIYFIDVGQGDSCLIITPNNKKILIDGGEGNPKILLSYLLDRRIKTLDYVMISHFDSDHCNGLTEVLENLNVKNIIISKQVYFCDEYKDIAKIINTKKINVIYAKQGDIFKVDKKVKIDIFYPNEELKYQDLNNNSIVAKVSYTSFSILFTRRYRKF